jgi:hypothetical protein
MRQSRVLGVAVRRGVIRPARWVDLGRDHAEQTGRRIAWAREEIEAATGPGIVAAAGATVRDSGRNGASSVERSAGKSASRSARSAGKTGEAAAKTARVMRPIPVPQNA